MLCEKSCSCWLGAANPWLPLWLCCRCLQMHKRLARMDDFLEYYRSNRRLQLNSDLAPPTNFIESYQNFIAQVCMGALDHDNRQSAQRVTLCVAEIRVPYESGGTLWRGRRWWASSL